MSTLVHFWPQDEETPPTVRRTYSWRPMGTAAAWFLTRLIPSVSWKFEILYSEESPEKSERFPGAHHLIGRAEARHCSRCTEEYLPTCKQSHLHPELEP